MPRPDLIVVTGDLTESGGLRECDEALTFLTGLRALLGLEPHRVAIVPGGHDITSAASRAYFDHMRGGRCRAAAAVLAQVASFRQPVRGVLPGLDGLVFESMQPWTLFAIEDLRVVIAGLNSTMARVTGQKTSTAGSARLRPHGSPSGCGSFERDGWLRIGAMRHDPVPGDVHAAA